MDTFLERMCLQSTYQPLNSKIERCGPKILEPHSIIKQISPVDIPPIKAKNAVKQLSNPKGKPLESGQT